LKLGISLELGAWDLELKKPPLGTEEKNKSEPASRLDSLIKNRFVMFLGNLAGLL
jgi:hypothetical protein